MELCPPSSLVALCKLYFLLLWLHSSLRPECWMGLMIQATHCVLPDEAIISLGSADWGKVYPSLYFYASVFFLFSSLSSFFFVLGQHMCNNAVMGLFVINASVTKIGHEQWNSCLNVLWKIASSIRFVTSVCLWLWIKSVHRAFTFASLLQVLIEASVSRERRGYIAIDDIMVLNYPCCKCYFWQ